MSHKERGSSLLIVLILLTVMALGALSLARVGQTSTALAGNTAFKAAAMQASEAGVNEAFAQLKGLTIAELDSTKGVWYFPTPKVQDAAGLPTGVDWSAASNVTVAGGYKASYVVERLCTGTMPVADITQQCSVKRVPMGGSAKAGAEQMDAPAEVQYRMTIFVQGPKGTQTFVQALATRTST